MHGRLWQSVAPSGCPAEDRSLLHDSKAATGCSWSAAVAESTMEIKENEHRKFELNALRSRQPVQFPEQWRYVLVVRTTNLSNSCSAVLVIVYQ